MTSSPLPSLDATEVESLYARLSDVLQPDDPDALFSSRFLTREVLERLIESARRSGERVAAGHGLPSAISGTSRYRVELEGDERTALTSVQGRLEVPTELTCITGGGRVFTLPQGTLPFQLTVGADVGVSAMRSARALLAAALDREGRGQLLLLASPPSPSLLAFSVPLALLEHGGPTDPTWRVRLTEPFDPISGYLFGSAARDEEEAERVQSLSSRLRQRAEGLNDLALFRLSELVLEASLELVRLGGRTDRLELALARCEAHLSALQALGGLASPEEASVGGTPRERAVLAQLFPELLRKTWNRISLYISNALSYFDDFNWREADEGFLEKVQPGLLVPVQLGEETATLFRVCTRAAGRTPQGSSVVEGWRFEPQTTGSDLMILGLSNPGVALGPMRVQLGTESISEGLSAASFVLTPPPHPTWLNYAWRGRVVPFPEGQTTVSARRPGMPEPTPATVVFLKG